MDEDVIERLKRLEMEAAQAMGALNIALNAWTTEQQAADRAFVEYAKSQQAYQAARAAQVAARMAAAGLAGDGRGGGLQA